MQTLYSGPWPKRERTKRFQGTLKASWRPRKKRRKRAAALRDVIQVLTMAAKATKATSARTCNLGAVRRTGTTFYVAKQLLLSGRCPRTQWPFGDINKHDRVLFRHQTVNSTVFTLGIWCACLIRLFTVIDRSSVFSPDSVLALAQLEVEERERERERER